MLCVDAGNTRLKWALGDADGQGWLVSGVCAHDDLGPMVAALNDYPDIQALYLSNVTGPALEAALQTALPMLTVQRVRSTAQALGVTNGYRMPSQLGVDRWCSLVAARQWAMAQAQASAACLVVSLGTATTVDALDSTGSFLGGLILPGVTLMRRSLAERTAQLPLLPEISPVGQTNRWPTSTDEAIVMGSLEATAGAIERAWQKLVAHEMKDKKTPPVCVLTGGAAEQLRPWLSAPVLMAMEVREHLVLEGIRYLAQAGEVV